MNSDTIDTLRGKGYLVNLHGKEYITHAGLLELAHSQGIESITSVIVSFDPDSREAVVLSTAVGERGTFTGIGDASPQNVSRNIASATLRMAETRSMNRAMRSYLGIGMTTAEEMPQESSAPSSAPRSAPARDAHSCPQCGGGVWDNAAKRAAGGWRGPAYKCKKECGFICWEADDAPWNK